MSADAARITCDIGGTFTDVVVSDMSGETTVAKALTQPSRLFDGLLAALERASEAIGEPLERLLGRTTLFIFSTTQATNAILEGTTARTALLCTEGFPDVLVRREGGSLRPYDYTRPYADAYVPRRLTFEVPERIDASGTVLVPLDEGVARERLRRAGALEAQAIAVCLLWATANPAHELTLGELIEEELPGVRYSLSHQLNPILREYRRASGTAIDASLKPLMQRHLPAIAAGLSENGFSGDLLAASSAGGVVPIGELIERPLWSVRSGPSLAPVGARAIAAAEMGRGDVIVCDTGGTSFDVSLVREGELVFTRETWLGEPFSGHLTGLSSVDVRSIGAGGGSIAWVDPGGLLRVGPESAGADPGPACYARGGTRPTVTDAALLLGYLHPDLFLGGEMKLDVAAARTAFSELAEALELGLQEVASAVLAIANERMIAAIHELTVNEGVDPRESVLLAGGGAAGLTILPIAAELDCREVLIPRAAGVLSAFGGQHSDIVREVTAPYDSSSDSFDFEGVGATTSALQRRMEEFEAELPAELTGRASRRWYVEARYAHQVWELSIPLAEEGVPDEPSLSGLVDSFHEAHERVFAVREPGQRIEMSQWKARVVIDTAKPPLASPRGRARGLDGGAASRRAYFAGMGEIETQVHLGDSLAPGARVAGPALLIEPETTIVVYPGWSAKVTELGNYVLERD
ncbi:MAG: hydantoinase/oxoprolinase family protein [Solirubrobacteraceae bacterium]